MGFSRFWEVRIIFVGHSGGPGAHFGGLATNFDDFWDRCENKLEKGTRGPPPKASSNPLFAVLWFGCFFRVFSVLVFCDFECPETPFWLQFGLLFGSPGPL